MSAALDPALLVIVPVALAVWLAIPTDYPDLTTRRSVGAAPRPHRAARHRRTPNLPAGQETTR
jgi:hypothetical protein